MDKIYVTVPCKEMRRMARASLQGKWFAMFVGAVIYYILNSCIPQALNIIFSKELFVEIAGKSVSYTLGYATGFYELILGGALLAGYLMFLVTFFRTEKIEYALTFEGFSLFGKAFLLYLLITIKVFLWSMLFVIPGIIAAFRYSQSFFVLLDNRELSPSQCIEESKRLMVENKGKLFLLAFSFIGWDFLAGIPSGIYNEFFEASKYQPFINMVLDLPMVVVKLYVGVAVVAFYEILTGRLKVAQEEYIPWENQNNGSNK